MQKLYGGIESNYLIYQDILMSTFFSFLTAQGASVKTQKNYWSDVAGFISWFIAAKSPVIDKENHNPRLLLQSLLPNHINGYVAHLLQSNIAESTVNRRLSSLRMFFTCAIQMTWLSYHPMEGIANLKMDSPVGPKLNTSIVGEFEHQLHSQGVSKATIKNYVSDVRGFLHWLETKGLLSKAQADGSP